MCGFVTPLEGSEADSHRKPEVSVTAKEFQEDIKTHGCFKEKKDSQLAAKAEKSQLQ